MRSAFDVIVVGVGGMGSAVCHHLAARGAHVLGLEQFDIPHAYGSSHGESRVMRLCYYEHPDYVPLLRRAQELWRELGESIGEELMHLVGGLYMGRRDCEFIAGTKRAAADHDLPHEILDHEQLAERFPQFVLPDDHVAVFEPNAGFLLPERCICAHAARALDNGGELHERETVRSWRADRDGVTVETDRGTYRGGHLVICAGAWTGRFLADLGIDLLVTRQLLGWLSPRQPELFAPGRFPIWGVDDPDGHFYYGFPMITEPLGLKVARHHAGEPTDPDMIDRQVRPGEGEELRQAVGRLLPGADGPLLTMAVCMYSNSADGHFIIDRHPHHPHVLFACGFSGHGFKFASVVGEALADLTLMGSTELSIGFLGLDRFRS